MAAGATYEPISTTTLGSNTNTVSFTSISSAYTDLIFVFEGTFKPQMLKSCWQSRTELANGGLSRNVSLITDKLYFNFEKSS